MSFNSFEKSQSNASIVELYEFAIGPARYRYASTEYDFVLSLLTYKASQIKRSKIKQSSNMHKDGITLTVQSSFELAKLLLNPLIDDTINVTVFRGHASDPDKNFIAYWLGRVVGCAVSGSEVEISCESVFTSIKRPGLRARFEINCRHTIYNSGCNATFIENASSAVVSAVNGSVVDIVTSEVYPSGYFTGGIATTSNGSVKHIANHVGDKLTFFQPPTDIRVTDRLVIAPGCDRSLAQCKYRFNNLDNFGGFPYIPIVNPFSPISSW